MEHLDKDLFWSRKYQKLKDKLGRRAILLQAKEYERRLEILNHENARILAAQDKSVSIEKFEGVVNQINLRGDQQDKEIKEISTYIEKQKGKSQLMQYIPWILTVISIILLYTKK